MNSTRTALVLVLVAGLVAPVGVLAAPAASPETSATADESPVTSAKSEASHGSSTTVEASAGTAATTQTGSNAAATAAIAASTDDQSSNDSSVSVGVGQQLSTVIAAAESDVGTEIETTAFEVSFERGDDRERAEAVVERAAGLRERAREISEDYREATRAFEAGEISRSEYAQRIAVLNARAENLLASHERLERRAANVSAFELTVAGLNRTALREAVDDVDAVTGAGASALLERFTGQRHGEIEIERADGLRVEAESEAGERSREVEIEGARDDDDAMTVEQSAALETARGALSTQNASWSLTKASVHTDSGYYKFEFSLETNDSTGEAEVRVDGSTGEFFRLEEEIERRGDDRSGDEHGEDHEDDSDDHDGDDDHHDGENDDHDGEHDHVDDAHEVDELALVVADGTPAPNATVTLLAVADGESLANATVRVDGERVGETGANGTIDVTLPPGSTTYTVVAGEDDAELEFEFEGADDERERDDVYRNIETSATLEDGTVSLSVTYNGTGVGDLTVYANDVLVGTTDNDGSLAFATNATEELEIELVRGELEAELEYRILDGSLVLEERAHEGDGDKIEEEVEDLRLSLIDGEPARNATVTVAVTAEGGPVENATVMVDDHFVGRTDADGRLNVTLPDADEVELTAIVGGEDAELEFEFEERASDDNEETESDDDEETETPEPDDDVDGLSLSVVAGDPAPGATITVEVTADGEPVSGATVSVEGTVVGETGADGTIDVTLPEDEDDPRVRAETDDTSGRIEFDFDD